MDWSIAPESFRTCRCGASLIGIQRNNQSARPSVTLLLDLIERLTDTFQRSSRCNRGCAQVPEYIQMLTSSLALLLDLLGGMAQEHLEENVGGSHRTGDSVATVNQYILNEGERKLLLRELLRGAVMNINHLARDVYYRRNARPKNMDSISSGSGESEMTGRVTSPLERPYAALARYGGSIRRIKTEQ